MARLLVGVALVLLVMGYSARRVGWPVSDRTRATHMLFIRE